MTTRERRHSRRRGFAILSALLAAVAGVSLLAFQSFANSSAPVLIQSPMPNERFVVNETVNLKVAVKDRHTDTSQVVWSSSLTGVLGKGIELEVSKLPPGMHTISVTANGITQSVVIREFKDLWELYQAPPAQAELDRVSKDFSLNWMDGVEADEKWAVYNPPVFDQASLKPSKVVALVRLDLLRHQVFSEGLPFANGLTVYNHLRKHVKRLNLSLDCADNSGGGGTINLRRWQNTWDLVRRDCKSATPSHPGLDGYVGPLYLMMHEARHSEPGEPGHTVCYGFSNMDGSLDKGSGHAQAALYAMWVYKYGVYDPPLMKQRARIAAYSLLSRQCSKPISSDARVQAILAELLGEKATSEGASTRLTAPKLLSPPEAVVLEGNPRHTTLEWSSVRGAAVYVVEWDYKSGKDWWSETPNRLPEQAKGWWAESRKPSLTEFPTTETTYAFDFVGAQPGRWRVWAVDAEGNSGTKSEWRGFVYRR